MQGLAEGSSMAWHDEPRGREEEVIHRKGMDEHPPKKACRLVNAASNFLPLLSVRTFGNSGFREIMRYEGAHALLPSSAGALAKGIVHGLMMGDEKRRSRQSETSRPAASSTGRACGWVWKGEPPVLVRGKGLWWVCVDWE